MRVLWTLLAGESSPPALGGPFQACVVGQASESANPFPFLTHGGIGYVSTVFVRLSRVSAANPLSWHAQCLLAGNVMALLS